MTNPLLNVAKSRPSYEFYLLDSVDVKALREGGIRDKVCTLSHEYHVLCDLPYEDSHDHGLLPAIAFMIVLGSIFSILKD